MGDATRHELMVASPLVLLTVALGIMPWLLLDLTGRRGAKASTWAGLVIEPALASGRVLGGYIPGADQQLLRLRIGVVGTPGVQSTIGIPDIARNGRFHTTWTPAPGNGTVHFWFSVSTLHEADFPFAPASSRRVDVIVR